MKNDWVVLNADKHPITTSKMVSEVFGKLHKNVVAKIEMLDFSSEFYCQNFFKTRSFNKNWKVVPAYEMTRDGFVFISIGFTGKSARQCSLEFIQAFDEIANKQKNSTDYTRENCGTSSETGDLHWVMG